MGCTCTSRCAILPRRAGYADHGGTGIRSLEEADLSDETWGGLVGGLEKVAIHPVFHSYAGIRKQDLHSLV